MSADGYAGRVVERFLSDLSIAEGPDSKFSVFCDKWDKEDYDTILEEVKEFGNAANRLGDFTPTGYTAIGDTFHSLKKAFPSLKSDKDIAPSYLVNKFVAEQLRETEKFEELRSHTVGDIVTSGLSCITLEPELEKIFDKLSNVQDKLEEMQSIMKEMAAVAAGASSGDSSDSLDEAEQKLQELEEKLKDAANIVDDDIEAKQGFVRQTLRKAVDAAVEETEAYDSMIDSWGIEPGELYAMPVDERMKLAKKLNKNKLKKIADLIGSVKRLVFSERRNRIVSACSKVCDVELGGDVHHLLPSEHLLMSEEEMDVMFFNKLVERNLLQYRLEGETPAGKGDMIVCVDCSGSMSGEKEIWAKAVAIALLGLCRKEKRGFVGLHFGSPGEYKLFDFGVHNGVVSTQYLDGKSSTVKVKELSYIDGVSSFAETFFSSGTDFMTPLTVGSDRLYDNYLKHGSVRGDIVFITDGQCSVKDEWFTNFDSKRESTGFTVWGVTVGMSPSGVMHRICDGDIFYVEDFFSGEDLKGLFSGI